MSLPTFSCCYQCIHKVCLHIYYPRNVCAVLIIEIHGFNVDHLYTSESDVCKRQILTYKDNPRTETIEIFITACRPITYVFK